MIQCIQSRRKERLSTLSKKLFTSEEVAAFKASPYVESATMRELVFTPEFKKIIYERIVLGEKIEKVLEEYGINTAAMGKFRVRGLQDKLEKYARREAGFERQDRSSKTDEGKAAVAEKRIVQLEHELAYMKQEVEFLKKVRQVDLEAWRQWESKHRHE